MAAEELTLKGAIERIGQTHPQGRQCHILMIEVPGQEDLYAVEEWLWEVEHGDSLALDVMKRMCEHCVRLEDDFIYSLEKQRNLYQILG